MMANISASSSSKALRESDIGWGWLLALGIGMTYWLTAVAVFCFGILAIIGGITQVLDSFHHKGWKALSGT